MNASLETLNDLTDFNTHPHDGWDFSDLIVALGRSFFQDQHPSGPTFGTPGEDSHHWVEQTTPFTCAIVSQEMILHAFGVDAGEAQLTYEATANGWLTEGGTSMGNLARLLELHGIATHTVPHGSVAELVAELAQGHKVIAAVDSGELQKTDLPWEDLFKAHGADHAIVITGLDMSDSAHPQVYINDPGDPKGAGKAYPLDEFLDAWADGGYLYVATDHAPSDLTLHSLFGSNFDSVSGMYMDGGFWQTFLVNLARTMATEAFSHSGFPWNPADHATGQTDAWETLSDTDRNDLFMTV